MIYSMTAFARAQSQGEFGSFVCEIRSINHRYLEISLHLPEVLRALEMTVRDQVRECLKRGKVDISLRYQPNPSSAMAFFDINLPLAEKLCQASEKIATYLQHPAPVQPAEILHFPGVLQSKEGDIHLLQNEFFHLLSKTLNDLLMVREREGGQLKKLFLNRIEFMQQQLNVVRDRLPSVMHDAQEKLRKRFNEAKMELDTGRLEQEIVLLAQKTDIAEEIDRLQTHMNEVGRVLEQGGMVGRRLDFLLQELNREANTLGSKSIDSIVTHSAVEIKVLIEQIREQVQNVE